jgi:PAS domain S-box-containing protein
VPEPVPLNARLILPHYISGPASENREKPVPSGTRTLIIATEKKQVVACQTLLNEGSMEKKSILIVEDEKIAALDLQETVQSLGYRVVGTVSSGEQAVAMVDTGVPDLILMDIRLAGEMSGIEAAERILAHHSVPIIYLTSFADPEMVERAKKTRPYGYIIKPYDERGIRTEIEIALYKFGLDQNFQKEYVNLAEWVQKRTEELARANEEIKESEAKFREIFNSANDAIHLHDVDEHGLPKKFIDVNDMACRMLQYSKDELIPLSPLDLTTDFHSIPLDRIGELMTTKGSVIFETEHKRKDGSVVPVEVNAHIVSIQGRRMVLSIIRDLSRRKHDEAALRSLSAEMQTIIDNAPGMIWYKDTKNNFIRVNPAGARAFGLPVDRIIGKNAGELFPDLADQYYQDDLEVIRSGKPKLGIVEQMTSASGETLWVQSDKVPIIDEKGMVTGLLVFVVDVTDRKIAQDALALANRKLGLMASITRHDILNQVMALNAYLELIRELSPDPTVSEYIQKTSKISASIERQISFTRDYQTIGVDAPTWQDVGGCIVRSTALLPMRNIRVVSDLHEVKVLADPLFEKIFYNLIDNALRYGGDGMKQIRIASEETDRGLTIIVEDDGAGISSEDHRHLFTKGFGKNTGFGLFLTREILGITGMEIRETGAPGTGARFEIRVPKGAYRLSR